MLRTLIGALASVMAVSAVLPSVAHAQSLASEQAARRTIYVPRDKSLSYRLPEIASRIVVAQPEIAKVTPTSDRSFYVQGMEFGSTNLLVYGPGGRLQEVIDVRVGYDAVGLQQDLTAAFPGEPIQVRNLGESVMLSGMVSSTGVQSKAERLAEKYAPDSVISRLTVRASQQVILQVRILEVSRSALQDLGVNLNIFNDSFRFDSGNGLAGASAPQTVISLLGGSGSTTINASLLLLEEKGLLRTLAKPDLVAVSGEKASFLAGGEFPFPVPQGRDQVTVDFRPYGVRLNFQPFVQDNGWIKMAVEPEVSQLDPANSVTLQGLNIPALTVRRANTVLELKSGDSFVIAGLYSRNYQNDAQQTPWIGDVPILGALFRSARWRKAETELVIIVTPRLATPADHAVAIQDLPGSAPKPLELQLFGRTEAKRSKADAAPAPSAPPAGK
jgi:pilus assembly protein CpaC